jgi:hypothetical protein
MLNKNMDSFPRKILEIALAVTEAKINAENVGA